MRLGLIPVGHSRNIVAAFKSALVSRPYLLPGDTKVLIEANRIGNMPAIKPPHRRAIVIMVRVPN